MNVQQKLVRLAGIALLALMAMFPPWLLSFDPQPDGTTSTSVGYYALWNPPSEEVPEEYVNSRYRIDLVRLGIQFVVVLAVVNCGILLNRRAAPARQRPATHQ